MKTEFTKFQLSKEKMNELRGGAQSCHCGGSDNYFTVTGANTFDELNGSVGRICGNAGWSCTPIR